VACMALPYFFSHYLIHGTIFMKYIYTHTYIYIYIYIYILYVKYELWFFLQLLPEIIFILRRIQQGIIINVHRSSREVPSSWQILIRLKCSRHIFEKSSDFKFHENPSSGGRVFPFGRTDGQTEMTRLTVAYHNFSNAPTKSL
jgi:hypothetical protein